jgi:hypothetical protein
VPPAPHADCVKRTVYYAGYWCGRGGCWWSGGEDPFLPEGGEQGAAAAGVKVFEYKRLRGRVKWYPKEEEREEKEKEKEKEGVVC